MTLDVFVGTFVKRSGTGTQSISGFGFQPKIVKITMVENVAVGFKADMNWSVGFGTSSSERACFMFTKHAGTDAGGERHSNTSIMGVIDNTGGILEEADLDSLDSDGITLDWETSTSTLMKFIVEAWGGSDIDDAHAFDGEVSESTGNHSQSGVGFQGDYGMFVNDGNVLANLFKNKMQGCFGHVTDSSNRWAVTGAWKNKAGKTVQTGGALENDTCFSVRKKPSQYDWEADFVSWDSDGFTMNITDAPMDPGKLIGMILKFAGDGGARVGTFAKSTNTSVPVDQSVTISSFDPRMYGLGSWGDAVNSSPENEHHPTFGMTDDVQEAKINANAFEIDSPVTNDTNYVENAVASMADGSENATINALANHKSMDTNGFTITWTINDSNADGIGYYAFEGAGGGLALVAIGNEILDLAEPTPIFIVLNQIVKLKDEILDLVDSALTALGKAVIADVDILDLVESPIKLIQQYVLTGTVRDWGTLDTVGTVRCILLKHDGAAEASRIYSVIDHTNANGSGVYTFSGIADNDPRYCVIAYNDEATDRRGVTSDDLTPVLT